MDLTKLESYYVGEEGCQVAIPFMDYCIVTEYDSYDKLFEYDKFDGFKKNNYVHDERKEQFPFNNIPIYKDMVYNYTLQILDFDKIYYVKRNVKLSDGYNPGLPDFYLKAVRSNDIAILITDRNPDSDVFHMTVDELKYYGFSKKRKAKIYHFFNSGYSREDIKKGKQLIREKKKQKVSK